MEHTEKPIPPSAEQNKQNHAWWSTLSDAWKQAFNETMLMRSDTSAPDDESLHRICQAQVLRFAGPTAPYPNMSVSLDDLSGLSGFGNLTILVVSHQKISSLKEISHLKQLKSLFVFNNRISSLEGIEGMTNLTELYFHANQVTSLEPLRNMTQLQTIACNHNKINSLEGVGTQHKKNLKTFTCLPNEQLPDEEVIRMEREVGIRCLRG